MARQGTGYYSQFYSSFMKIRRKGKWHQAGGALLGFNMLGLFQNPDAIDPEVKTAKIAQFRNQTGWERLRAMFSYDAYGNISPELSTVMQGAMMGVFTGTILGGTMSSRNSFVEFIEKNQGTAFQNTFEAKKQLQNKVTIGFARGAWMLGWRLGMFCGSFMLFTTSIAVYRGKSSIIEYIAAGGATGTLYKFKQGPRAAVVGGIVGSALGTVAGCVSLTIMYLTGTTMEEMRYWQYHWKEEKEAKKVEALRKARAEDLDILTLSHDQNVDPSKAVLGPSVDEGKTKG